MRARLDYNRPFRCVGLTREWASAFNSLRDYESNGNEDADEGCENADQEERLDLLAFPQSDRRLAAFDDRELHDVEHCDKLQNGENREEGAEGQSNPQDELVEDEAQR